MDFGEILEKKSQAVEEPPSIVKRTVAPGRRRNGDLRTGEYLTEAEVERLIDVAQGNRHSHRDATMILAAYRHGLRVSELADLRYDPSILESIELETSAA
jgi:site-specific recombinase XerD